MRFALVTMVLALVLIGRKGYAQGDLKRGVVEIRFRNVDKADTVTLFEPDGAVYGYLTSSENGNVGIVVNNRVLNEKMVQARYIYLDYRVLVFDCLAVTSKHYRVLFNNHPVVIERGKGRVVKFSEWQTFLKTVIVNLDKRTPLLSDTVSGKIIPNYTKYAYRVKRVAGEWCYVECFKECDDGCPTTPMHGWVRWKKGKKLLLDIRFEC